MGEWFEVDDAGLSLALVLASQRIVFRHIAGDSSVSTKCEHHSFV